MPHRPDEAPPGLVELRLLDGPNLYFPTATVKVVLDVSGPLHAPDLGSWAEGLGQADTRPGTPDSDLRRKALLRVAATTTRGLAAAAGTGRLAVRARSGPGPAEVTVAFPWKRRERGRALGVALAAAFAGVPLDVAVAPVRSARGEAPSTPRPRIPVVAVTGTNGKTTTTRLVAHMGRCAGQVVGWSNTDGVWVDGDVVEEGDWSGYGGAGLVLSYPRVDLAVLETARGGLLLRGFGAAWNDVSVVTNVSADHLGLQGITTLDQLAEVKAIVPRSTRAGGWCVLNADDPRVLAMRSSSKGRPWTFSLDPDSPGLRAALDAGGRGCTLADGQLAVVSGDWEVDELVPVVDVPMTLSGLSTHNLANALAGAAAGLAIGLPREAVVEGLRTFRPDASLNPGRLNLYDVSGAVVCLDLAHNEDSLAALLRVVHGLRVPGARVLTVLGAAGDRDDDALRTLGHQAAHGSDLVVIGEKERYLRGRSREGMTALFREGLAEGGMPDVAAFPDELSALQAAVSRVRPGDVVAFMCHADRALCEDWLRSAGAVPLTPAAVREMITKKG
jgi:cyanophycin synthetase